DIQNIFLQCKNSEQKCHTATQTTGSLSSSPTDNVAKVVMRSFGRLNSFHGCGLTIADDKMVNMAVSETWTSENEVNVLVPQAKPRVQRFHIYENMAA